MNEFELNRSRDNWYQEIKNKVIVLLNQGISDDDIIKQLNISKKTLDGIIKKNLDIINRPATSSAIQEEIIVKGPPKFKVYLTSVSQILPDDKKNKIEEEALVIEQNESLTHLESIEKALELSICSKCHVKKEGLVNCCIWPYGEKHCNQEREIITI